MYDTCMYMYAVFVGLPGSGGRVEYTSVPVPTCTFLLMKSHQQEGTQLKRGPEFGLLYIYFYLIEKKLDRSLVVRRSATSNNDWNRPVMFDKSDSKLESSKVYAT